MLSRYGRNIGEATQHEVTFELIAWVQVILTQELVAQLTGDVLFAVVRMVQNLGTFQPLKLVCEARTLPIPPKGSDHFSLAASMVRVLALPLSAMMSALLLHHAMRISRVRRLRNI